MVLASPEGCVFTVSFSDTGTKTHRGEMRATQDPEPLTERKGKIVKSIYMFSSTHFIGILI